ncbi:dTMP kinase [Desulfotomaculum defluvii]
MKNLFIVFEGIDGSGTSTQATMLRDYLLNKSRNAVLTCEPSDGPVGHLIREAMKKRLVFSSDPKLFDYQMAYLFAADRHDHLYNEIDGVLKLLENNTVISTRYFFSSFAYHCDTDKDFIFISKLNEQFRNPDLVIYIENDIEISLQRIKSRTSQDVYENKTKLEKVKKNYEKIFKQYEGDLFRVRGNDDFMVIHKKIINYIKENYYGV